MSSAIINNHLLSRQQLTDSVCLVHFPNPFPYSLIPKQIHLKFSFNNQLIPKQIHPIFNRNKIKLKRKKLNIRGMSKNVIEIRKCMEHVIIIHHHHHSQNVHKKKSLIIINHVAYHASAPCAAWQFDTYGQGDQYRLSVSPLGQSLP